MKLWEGNVFTPVILFTGGGDKMSLPVCLPGPMFLPEEGRGQSTPRGEVLAFCLTVAFCYGLVV